jgi:hypothetical protein
VQPGSTPIWYEPSGTSTKLNPPSRSPLEVCQPSGASVTNKPRAAPQDGAGSSQTRPLIVRPAGVEVGVTVGVGVSVAVAVWVGVSVAVAL